MAYETASIAVFLIQHYDPTIPAITPHKREQPLNNQNQEYISNLKLQKAPKLQKLWEWKGFEL